MAYIKNTWVDQDVERPKTYEVTNNQDGSITLTDSFGLVTELGTPVNEVNMNHIEEGIDGCAIRKHNLTEIFNLGEWVLGGTGDDQGIYKSLIANYVGNAITDDTAWEKVEMGGGSGYEVGDIIIRNTPTNDAGKHLLDGALISGGGSYQAFVDYIADLYADNPTADYFTDEASWQSAVTTYGVCGKFVYDSVNNTVRLPKYSNKIYTGGGTAPVVGNGMATGFTNGTNNYGLNYANYNNVSYGFVASTNAYGANVGTTYTTINPQASNQIAMGVTSDGSKSGLIAQLSNITTSLEGYYYIVISTSTKTDIQVDIDEIATDLNGKADTDLSNVPTSKGILTESYTNGTSWYRIYSDGWCEQGDKLPGTNNFSYVLNFLVPFKDTNYYIGKSYGGTYTGNCLCSYISFSSKTISSVITYSGGVGEDYRWHACGYIR